MSSTQISRIRRAARPEWRVLLAVFVVGFLVILSRKPDVVFSPQFYIEDGFYWYAGP